MPEFTPRQDSQDVASPAGAGGALDPTAILPGAGPARAPDVNWPAEMLEADPASAAGAFDRAINALARRLPPVEAARFLFSLDSALYARLGAAAIAAEGAAGEALHPKHRLTRYHEFFLTRIGVGERVADLGCGNGALATDIARTCGAHLVGLDMSAQAVEAARARAAGMDLGNGSASFVLANIADIARDEVCPGLDETFDVIVLSNVLEHLTARALTLRALAARLRVTRLLIRVPAYERDWRVAYKRDLGVEWRLDPTHEVEHSREELAAEILAAGLQIETFDHRWGEYYVVARAR